ncbi:type IV secretory system conjugative DNA transfer family protein [Enterobacter vonholyi]|uniref:type IV secretory system conjugative DNA transfer family protein n=1 Tax=Enterobacter vonholyi TaxID=2797505 RepID=UPI002DBB60F1|nr:type IV secretory system conjugative DNA transfer family protein [Enterobacter vonholyi]MEB5981796.1 type IV secretion system DotC family protein [Enterobacter vonholyi]
MFRIKLLVCLLALAWAGAAAADAPYDENPAPSFNEILNGFNNSEGDTVRITVLRDMGETIGFRTGLVWEAQNIAKGLKKKESVLDRLYNFGSLMTNESSLPPVIVEANDLASVSKDQFRTANKAFNIVKPEEFVSVPPTWRDYLFTGLLQQSEVIYPSDDARPKTSAEKNAWETSLKKGWNDGVAQAQSILDENFSRLGRDYNGMMRFNALLRMGMISRTEIASKVYTVSPESNKNTLTIGEKHREIMKKAQFEVNPDKWKPVITKSPTSDTSAQYQYGGR